MNFRQESQVAFILIFKYSHLAALSKKIMKYNFNEICYIYFCFSGTPPFTITWFKDGRELPDNDYYKYVIYGDGGVALRLSQVRPQDAGEYTCVVRNDFGVASCNSLFAVQGLIYFHF